PLYVEVRSHQRYEKKNCDNERDVDDDCHLHGCLRLNIGTTNSLLGFGARELCDQFTYRQSTALGLGSNCFLNQVAAKNRLTGERVLQSRGELDGVASP